MLITTTQVGQVKLSNTNRNLLIYIKLGGRMFVTIDQFTEYTFVTR